MRDPENRRKWAREYYKAHPEDYIRRAKKSRDRQKNDPLEWRKWAVTVSRARAKKQNVPHTIVATDIDVPLVCPVLGIALKPGTRLGDSSPSLDRFIPSLGYIPGNVAVISTRANRMKFNASTEEVRKLLTWMEAQNFKHHS